MLTARQTGAGQSQSGTEGKNRLLERIAQKSGEGSIKAMGMQLTDLRNEYESLSEEQRNNVEMAGSFWLVFNPLTKTIKDFVKVRAIFVTPLETIKKLLAV